MATRRARFVALAKETEVIEKERKTREESDRMVAANALEQSRAAPMVETEREGELKGKLKGKLRGKLVGRVRALAVMWQEPGFRVAVHFLGMGVALLVIFSLLASGARFDLF